MCGIAGFHRFGDSYIPKINRFIDELLKGIEPRGRDATGYAFVCDDGECAVQKASLPAKEFVKHSSLVPYDARTVILHTRYATNGHPAFPENNHPTVAGSIMSVHNGVIQNDGALFKNLEHERLGVVDSEVIPAMVNENGGLDTIANWIDKVEGSFALAISDGAAPGRLALVRGHSSPLLYYVTDKLIVWASTYSAIKDAWSACFGTPPAFKNVISLDEGEIMQFDQQGEITELRSTFTPASSWTTRYYNRSAAQCALPASTTVTATGSVTRSPGAGYTWEVTPDGWMVRCGICDTYTEDESANYNEGLWVCDDCMTYVGGLPARTPVDTSSAEDPTYDEIITAAAEEVVNAAKEGSNVVSIVAA